MLNNAARCRVQNRLCGHEWAISKARDYLMLWSRSLVLKDPQLLYALPFWLEAARRSGKRPTVYFATRAFRDLEEAWRAAPFTKPLLKHRIHYEMNNWALQQWKYCERAGVASVVHELPVLNARKLWPRPQPLLVG
jgi:hypothetical protein